MQAALHVSQDMSRGPDLRGAQPSLVFRALASLLVHGRMMHRSLLLLRLHKRVFQHDFRSLRSSSDSRCGVCGWLGVGRRNLRIRVVGAVQLGRGLSLEFKPDRRNFTILQRLLQIDDEVSNLGILGVLSYSDLDLRSCRRNHDSRNRRLFALKQTPQFIRVLFGAECEDGLLIGERERGQVRSGHNKIVNLLLRALGGRDGKGSRREERGLSLLLDRIQAVETAVIFLVVILEFGFDLRLVVLRSSWSKIPSPRIEPYSLFQVLRWAGLAVRLRQQQCVVQAVAALALVIGIEFQFRFIFGLSGLKVFLA